MPLLIGCVAVTILIGVYHPKYGEAISPIIRTDHPISVNNMPQRSGGIGSKKIPSQVMTDDHQSTLTTINAVSKAVDNVHFITNGDTSSKTDDNVITKADESVIFKAEDGVVPKANAIISKADNGFISKADVDIVSKSDDGVIPKADVEIISKADDNIIAKAEDNIISKANGGVIFKAGNHVISKATDDVISKADDAVISTIDGKALGITVDERKIRHESQILAENRKHRRGNRRHSRNRNINDLKHFFESEKEKSQNDDLLPGIDIDNDEIEWNGQPRRICNMVFETNILTEAVNNYGEKVKLAPIDGIDGNKTGLQVHEMYCDKERVRCTAIDRSVYRSTCKTQYRYNYAPTIINGNIEISLIKIRSGCNCIILKKKRAMTFNILDYFGWY